MPASTRVFQSRRPVRTIAGLGVAAALVATAPAAYASGTAFATSSTSSDTTTVADTPGATAITLTLPAPTGHRQIGTISLHLVDRSRSDPWMNSRSYRELMVSIWYPARKAENLRLAPQMTPLAAADFDRTLSAGLFGLKPGTVDWAATMTHARLGAPVDTRTGGLPVVFFSPGFGAPRTVGTVLVEELASRGYIVVTVDHTYDAAQVEFPGGRVERTKVPPSEITEAVLKKALEIRVTDMKFVLDQLARLDRGLNPDAERRPLPAGLRGLDLSRIGMLGHSMGGETAAQLVHEDRRLDAGINLDGGFGGPVIQTGVTKPFLQVAAEPRTRANVIGWQSFWDKSTGWKRELQFAGATHYSFTDAEPFVAQLPDKLKAELPNLAEVVGTIDPDRAIAAQRAYVTAFFDLHLKGRHTRLFDGPSKRYPEVKHVP